MIIIKKKIVLNTKCGYRYMNYIFSPQMVLEWRHSENKVPKVSLIFVTFCKRADMFVTIQ